jgi:hypothetical protein
MYRPLSVESFDMRPQFGFRSCTSSRINGQRQLQQRITSVFKVVVIDGFDARQRFQDANDGRFRQSEQILSVEKLRENADNSILSADFFYGSQNLLPHSLTGPILRVQNSQQFSLKMIKKKLN